MTDRSAVYFREIIIELLDAMIDWGNEEDGIPEFAVNSFDHASISIGRLPLPPNHPSDPSIDPVINKKQIVSEKYCYICQDWARCDREGFMAKHHPNCPYYNIKLDAREIIKNLLYCMDKWGNEEDGIPSFAISIYNTAYNLINTKPSKK